MISCRTNCFMVLCIQRRISIPVRVQRRLLLGLEAPRRGLSAPSDHGQPQRERGNLHRGPVDLRGGHPLLESPRVLQRVLPLHVPREEVLAPLSELHIDPQAAGEGGQADHVPLRRPRGLRLSQDTAQHGQAVLPQEGAPGHPGGDHRRDGDFPSSEFGLANRRRCLVGGCGVIGALDAHVTIPPYL